MARIRLDGNNIYEDYTRIGSLDGMEVKDSSGLVVGRIRGNNIEDRHYNTIARVEGNDINDNHFNRIGRITDVRHIIDGPGGVSLAAIWVLLIR